MLKHCAANKKRRLSALPNVGPYIYDVKICGFTRSSIYIYIYISRLRDNIYIYMCVCVCVFPWSMEGSVNCTNEVMNLCILWKCYAYMYINIRCLLFCLILILASVLLFTNCIKNNIVKAVEYRRKWLLLHPSLPRICVVYQRRIFLTVYVRHYGFLLKTLVICCPGASDFTFIHEGLKNKEKCWASLSLCSAEWIVMANTKAHCMRCNNR
jgi:hypothetical protein